jgi:hypothetical protein
MITAGSVVAAAVVAVAPGACPGFAAAPAVGAADVGEDGRELVEDDAPHPASSRETAEAASSSRRGDEWDTRSFRPRRSAEDEVDSWRGSPIMEHDGCDRRYG